MQPSPMILSNTNTPDDPRRPGFRTSAARPLAMLASCPVYASTPLTDHAGLASESGLHRLWVKDETRRMGLGSFKALGGAFAVAQKIAERSGSPDPMSDASHNAARDMTFITASAGNHGLSVAAGARVFSARSRIVLSENVPEAFAERIRRTGGEIIRVGGSYEDSVAEAARLAQRHGWLLLADGSWQGYTAAPALVMEGYTVLAEECRQYFAALAQWPSHVVLQAGVGGLAAAIAGHIRDFWDRQPEIVIVEPQAAPCLQESVRAGRLSRADGPVSNMGRLDCKDASLLAFETLAHDADSFVTITDKQAQAAADRLARAGLATTPSGAAGYAALATLGLPRSAHALIVVSEGPEST